MYCDTRMKEAWRDKPLGKDPPITALLRFYLISVTASNGLGSPLIKFLTYHRLGALRPSLSLQYLASYPAVIPSLPPSKLELDRNCLRGCRIEAVEVNEIIARRQILDVPKLVSGNRAFSIYHTNPMARPALVLTTII